MIDVVTVEVVTHLIASYLIFVVQQLNEFRNDGCDVGVIVEVDEVVDGVLQHLRRRRRINCSRLTLEKSIQNTRELVNARKSRQILKASQSQNFDNEWQVTNSITRGFLSDANPRSNAPGRHQMTAAAWKLPPPSNPEKHVENHSAAMETGDMNHYLLKFEIQNQITRIYTPSDMTSYMFTVTGHTETVTYAICHTENHIQASTRR